jgi:hypothetical protein
LQLPEERVARLFFVRIWIERRARAYKSGVDRKSFFSGGLLWKKEVKEQFPESGNWETPPL